ncbi:MAG: histidinol-phosphatase HisJ family protein [Clostridia bacterium]|nr:histidinol-phosphatase HisJ family protein [Clostridia bacterium]
MYLCDNHTHTKFSFDGSDSPDALCEAAIRNGVHEISITDHYDIDGIAEGIYTPYLAEEAKAAILAARDKYAGRLQVNYGIELGQANHMPEESAAFIEKYGFDYVLGSIHNLRGVPDFCYLKYEDMSDRLIELLIERSLDEILEIARLDYVTTLAHITYPHRYATLAKRDVDLMKFTDRFRAIFKEIIERGISLEINTSTLRTAGITMPTYPVFRLYRECGGELVSFGSDSHKSEYIGYRIPEAQRILADMGFAYQTVIREGKPYPLPLK